MKKPQDKTCSYPTVGHSEEEEKVSACFLKSLKAANRNRSVFSMSISKKKVEQSRQVTLICPICWKPDLNLISSVTDGFYLVVHDPKAKVFDCVDHNKLENS